MDKLTIILSDAIDEIHGSEDSEVATPLILAIHFTNKRKRKIHDLVSSVVNDMIGAFDQLDRDMRLVAAWNVYNIIRSVGA